MDIEYEATFLDINKKEVRKKLKKAGAVLVRPEYLQKRIPFHLPKEKRTKDKFVRVRDEAGEITLSLKEVPATANDKIESQKEVCLKINDFDKAVEFLKLIGCKPKSYQETKREIWKLEGVEIMIDEWPFLEPLIEIEGESEKKVKEIAEKLGFNYKDALFCAVTEAYRRKYNISTNKIITLPKIVFDMENPFLRKKA